MSRVLLTLLYFTNIYTLIICHTKCKEYIIIMSEVSCTNGSSTWEPIKLHDVEWDHDECSADSSEILSYDKSYSNESYVVRFDNVDSESICIPILKSKKLLGNIEILEDYVESENTTTIDVEEKIDNDTKTSMLECLIRNYTYACDKKTTKVIDIDSSKCKEYIIIMSEVSCTNGSSTWEPIKLHDIEWDHDECSADSSEILSYDKSYSNESYVVRFDNVDSESICIPILKSKKLLGNIEILEDYVESENTTTIDVEEKKDNDTKTSMLECLIRNYTYACDKKTTKVIDIDLIYANESTVKSLDSIVNKKEDLLIFKECKVTRDLCINGHHLLNISIFDEYVKNNHSMAKTIVVLFGNGNGTVPVALNSNNFTNWNCTNISNNVTNIMLNDQLTSLTHNILTKYACLNELDNPSNISIAPTYNIKVYLPMDITAINTKNKYINCEENFNIVKNNALGINCNIVDISVLEYTSSTTTESKNISSTDSHILESDSNCTLIWHCYLDNVKMSKENYSESVEIIRKFKELDFVNCTEDYKNMHKDVYKDSSKAIMLSSEGDETFEDLAPIINSKSIILNFIPNLGDCDETVSFNLTRVRIISLLPEDKSSKLLHKSDSTVIKLTILNCVNNYKKGLSTALLELDLIFSSENITNLNSFITNELKNAVSNSTERVILNCVYFDKTIHILKASDEGISAMECKFIKLDHSKSPIREPYMDYHNYSVSTETAISAKPKENETVSVSEKDITETTKINATSSEKNIMVTSEQPKDNATVTTSKIDSNVTTENPKNYKTVATSKKYITDTTENPKENKTTTKQDTTTVPNETITTESNTTENWSKLHKYDQIYYVSPKVYILAVVAVIAVVSSVLIYAFYLFRRRKTDYQEANTRDWAAMDETQF